MVSGVSDHYSRRSPDGFPSNGLGGVGTWSLCWEFARAFHRPTAQSIRTDAYLFSLHFVWFVMFSDLSSTGASLNDFALSGSSLHGSLQPQISLQLDLFFDPVFFSISVVLLFCAPGFWGVRPLFAPIF